MTCEHGLRFSWPEDCAEPTSTVCTRCLRIALNEACFGVRRALDLIVDIIDSGRLDSSYHHLLQRKLVLDAIEEQRGILGSCTSEPAASPTPTASPAAAPNTPIQQNASFGRRSTARTLTKTAADGATTASSAGSAGAPGKKPLDASDPDDGPSRHTPANGSTR